MSLLYETNAARVRAASVVATAMLLSACATSLSPFERTVTIQLTAYGVAHIEAADYESLSYGVAYAHARDNVCQTADHLVTMRGERSRYFGPSTHSLLGLRPLPNDQIDVFIRARMDDAALAAANGAASADAAAMARGYVAGYNRYLQDNAERLPAPCKGQPWVRPMTIEEFRRTSELLAIQLGSGALAGGVAGARPPAPAAAASSPPSSTSSTSSADALAALDAAGLLDPAVGSNGWAFGADVTANRRGLVVGNPHFPWFGVNRFWQVHLSIPGRLDVMGVSIGQSPVVVIGFNRDLAWTHTVSTGRRFTLFELTLQPGDPTSYIVDGKPEKMLSKTIRYDVKGADGQVTTRETTQWTSRWGPLFVLPRAGLNWSATTAYAIKDAPSLNVRWLDTWLAIDRARSVNEIREAVASLGIPWVNTIAADRNGDALYVDASNVPDVDAAQLQRCVPSKPAADLLRGAGIVVLNGARSDCDWSRDRGSPMPGLISAERMPMLVRRDWVQNSNDSFWLTNPAARLEGFSPLVGNAESPQNLRTRSGIDAIQRATSGGALLDLTSVEALVLSDRNYTAAIVLDDLLAACAEALQASTVEACAVLVKWDRRNDLESRGAHLFREWSAAASAPGIWRVPFNPADPLNTPAGLDLSTPQKRTRILDALDHAAATVRAAGFALDAPLGEVQGHTVGGRRIPLHGGTNGEGVLNVIDSDGALGRNGYVPTTGTSYLQAVTFDARGPIADGLLTYGQSSQPDSPFAFDQLELFSRKRWLPLPFHRADIERMRVGEPLTLTIR